MKKIKLIAAIAIAISVTVPINVLKAQAKPLWEHTPDGGLIWMRNTSLGNLIECTSTGLKGIDPASGKENWNIPELESCLEETFEEIKNTPYIAIAPKDDKDELYIIEPFEGKILFSSKESGISKIASKYFLYKNNVIILVGYEGGDEEKAPVMVCVDMTTGKKIWTKKSDFSKVSACISLNDKEIILTTLFFAYKINAKTGAEVWKQCIDPAFAKMSNLLTALDKGGANLKKELNVLLIQTELAPDRVFMAAQIENKKEVKGPDGKMTTSVTYDSFYNAFKTIDGSYGWKTPLKISQGLGVVLPCREGLVVCAKDKETVNLVDFSTGLQIWGGKKVKGIEVKGGPVKSAVIMNNNLLLATGSKETNLSLIDPANSESKFAQPISVDGDVQRIVELPNGFLVVATEQIEYVNKITGESYLKKPIVSNSALLGFTDEDVYIFNKKDGKIYTFIKNEIKLTALKEEIKFEGKESPTKLEILKEGICLSSEQNVWLVGFDGKLIYKKYFPAPKESNFRRALLYASAARAAYYTLAYGYTSAMFGATSAAIQVQNPESKVAKDVSREISKVYGQASLSGLSATSKFLNAASNRYKATSQTEEFMFVLTEVGKKEYHFLKVSKIDGQTKEDINLGKDKKPKYELDNIENVIYFEESDKLKAFKL